MKFILATQDDETGGFADRPGDMVCCCRTPSNRVPPQRSVSEVD